MDEAIREIRTLEEKNADLEVQLHRANTQANLSESAEAEIKIYNQKLNSGKVINIFWKFKKKMFLAEIRLEELQRSLNEANEDNDQLRQDATNWRLRADERQHTIQGFWTKISKLKNLTF